MTSIALAAARRWLTGQMPQSRWTMTGTSQYSRPRTKRSNPRNSTTWNRAWSMPPFASRWMVTLPCPSTRVTGLMTIFRVACAPAVPLCLPLPLVFMSAPPFSRT